MLPSIACQHSLRGLERLNLAKAQYLGPQASRRKFGPPREEFRRLSRPFAASNEPGLVTGRCWPVRSEPMATDSLAM